MPRPVLYLQEILQCHGRSHRRPEVLCMAFQYETLAPSFLSDGIVRLTLASPPSAIVAVCWEGVLQPSSEYAVLTNQINFSDPDGHIQPDDKFVVIYED